MFTIKQINMIGEESLYSAQSVRYTPGTSSDKPGGGTPATVWIDEMPLTGGTVFVMNDAGKTISRYDIGASPVPLPHPSDRKAA